MLYKKQQDYGYVYGNQPGSFDIKSITLPPRYQGDPVLLRGCFVLAVPDRCYMAKNGLSYCWCSQKDLCNAAGRPPAKGGLALAVATAAVCLLWSKLLS